jgi:hypothetical protein
MNKLQHSTADQCDSKVKSKPPNLLWNLVFNLILPTLILTNLSGQQFLDVKLAILIALAFPVAYGIRELINLKKVNFFSALGIVSVALMGSISLLELDPVYIAIKEAAIPGMLGIATLLSLKTSQPLIHTFLLNESVMNMAEISKALKENSAEAAFDKLLVNASWVLSGSFFLSSALNYILAVVLLTADPGTEIFNQQLGRMTALSFPVIALPLTLFLMANLVYVFRGITRLTGMPFEDILNVETEKK